MNRQGDPDASDPCDADSDSPTILGAPLRRPAEPVPRALLGPDEARRLVALYQLDVLDSPSAECFERVARLAARLFEVPYAMVSLVDAAREWCLAREGELPAELPREHSLAEHVMVSGGMLVVEDTSVALSLYDHPLVIAGPRIRFLAGYPLRSATGAAVGALCVLGLSPRRLRANEAQTLRKLAGVVEDEITLRANRCFDERTGMLLRRGLDIVGSHVLSRVRRQGEPVSLVVIDVESMGAARRRAVPRGPAGPSERSRALEWHPSGGLDADRAGGNEGTAGRARPVEGGEEPALESAIRLIASVIAGATRASDVPARLPCDELVVMLPDTDEKRCRLVAQRLGDEIESAARQAGLAGTFEVQLGTATLNGLADEVTLAALLRSVQPVELGPSRR